MLGCAPQGSGIAHEPLHSTTAEEGEKTKLSAISSPATHKHLSLVQ